MSDSLIRSRFAPPVASMLFAPFRRCLSLFVLLSLAGLCLALPTQADDTDLLIERVHAFLYEQASELGEEVSIDVHPPSAHLPACENPQPFLPNAGQKLTGRVSVGVRCGDQGRQVRYMQASIEIVGEQVVARQAIPAGTIIDADMLAIRPSELGRLPRGAITDPEQAIGMQASRPIGKGVTMTENHLRAVTLVERGAKVRIEARGEGFAVSREGEALDNGAMGQEIRVRLGRRETLRARVTGRNRLEVDF